MTAPIPPSSFDSVSDRPVPSQLANLQDYLRIVVRHGWGVLGLAVLGGLIAWYQCYRAVPIYRAVSSLLIEREPARFVSVEELIRDQYYDSGEYYQTQYELLKSRPIAERVVKRIGLESFEKVPVQAPSFWSRFWPGSSEQPAPAKVEGPVDIRTARAVALVQSSIQVQPVRNSQLVRIVYSGPDPELVTRLANVTGQAYIEEMLEGRLQMAQEAAGWLNERIGNLRTKLGESEQALQAFRDRENLVDIKGVDSMTAEQISLGGVRLAEARRERIEKEADYRQVQQAKSQGTRLDSVPVLLANPLVADMKRAQVAAERTLSELSQRYGPMHPKMAEAKAGYETANAALERQLELAVLGVTKAYEAAQSRESQLSSEIGSAKSDMQSLNRKQYQLAALQREVDANKQVFDMFQARFKETTASGGVQSANARVVEPALEPKYPFYPNTRRTVGFGLALGLLLGIGLAFVLDHLDNTLKGAEDVERRLGLPVLGLLPKLKSTVMGKRDSSPLRHVRENPKSSFSEAVRSIRTAVLLSAIDHPQRRVLITSSVPGEGKTTLASNLAYSLGQMRKVLLIDADMRRPAVHRAIPELGQTLGLSQFVSGEATIAQCLHHVEGTNLFVMRAGAVPPNPLELLSSKRFEDALEGLSKAFDHIIIDCAPACAVSDALVLSRMVHAVIYVVRSDSTPWQLADQGLRRLRRASAPLIGAVVNQVIPHKSRYGYGYNYGKYYYGGEGYYPDYGYHSGKGS